MYWDKAPLEYGKLLIFIAGAISLSVIINSQLVMPKGVAYRLFIGVLLMIGRDHAQFCTCWNNVPTIMTLSLCLRIFYIGYY